MLKSHSCSSRLTIGFVFKRPWFCNFKMSDLDRCAMIDVLSVVGVQKVIVTGLNVRGSEEALKLCREYPSYLWCTVGKCSHDVIVTGLNRHIVLLRLTQAHMLHCKDVCFFSHFTPC